MTSPSHKKPRLEDGEAQMDVSDDSSPPSFVDGILQQTKGEFDAKLDSDWKGGTNTIFSTLEKLDALEDKLTEMSSWILDYKLKLQKEDRVRRKAEREEKLQAIYQQKQQQQPSSSDDTNNNPPCLFTAESATALLDSGFLRDEEIGKLFLLTGKMFFSHLDLDSNFVWRKIFEAAFHYKSDHGLSVLYQSQKFEKMLQSKGYEWMFRNIFPDRNSANGTQQQVPVIDPKKNQDLPAPSLNHKNIFFVAVVMVPDDYGFGKAIHAAVWDNEERIEGFLSSGEPYKDPISSDETAERLKHRFERYDWYKQHDDEREAWQEELIRRFDARQQNFERTFGRSVLEQRTTNSLINDMLKPDVSIFALRLDTNECTDICGAVGHYYASDDSSVFWAGATRLNGIGENLVRAYLAGGVDEEDGSEISMYLKFRLNLKSGEACFETWFEANKEIDGDSDSVRYNSNLYPVLDYGIDWEPYY